MKKVLYIEDNIDTAATVKTILDSAGFETETAYSGGEALEIVKKKRFDLIIIDIMLPDMSGWETLKKLKERKVKSKFVFLGAILVPEEKMKSLREMGVLDYITKPFEKDDFVTRIKRILTTT